MQTYLEKRDLSKNKARFYRMAVLPNLFGEWTLERQWGRIGQMEWLPPSLDGIAMCQECGVKRHDTERTATYGYNDGC